MFPYQQLVSRTPVGRYAVFLTPQRLYQCTNMVAF
jgi:hypothetical protein